MESSTKPYLVRAIYEWCSDNNFTPFIAVDIDSRAKLPLHFAREGKIVLNISEEATSGLIIDNEFITFKARFSGVSHDVIIPVDNVMAIYASENGHGMGFDVKKKGPFDQTQQENDQKIQKKEKGPTLTRVK